jgi:hypothetical protein
MSELAPPKKLVAAFGLLRVPKKIRVVPVCLARIDELVRKCLAR